MNNNDRWSDFNNIIDTLELDIKEKGLLLILFRYVNYKAGYANPSRSLIKKKSGISDNRTLDKIFDSLIEKGFLIRESGKGIRSKYFIKVGVEKEPSVEITPSVNVTPTPSGEITPSVGGEITPQKEKKKKTKENIYSIFDYWNSKNIIKHKQLTAEIEKAINKSLKSYKEEDILKAIDTYSEILNSDFYFKYKWSLKDFLNRSNGISTFMEEGTNKVNYINYKSSKDVETNKTIDRRDFF